MVGLMQSGLGVMATPPVPQGPASADAARTVLSFDVEEHYRIEAPTTPIA